jgi:hypothetical protein
MKKPEHPSTRQWLWIACFPIVMGAIANSLYAIQGGFGGGDCRFDGALYFLGLPSILITPNLNIPGALAHSDLLPIIWVPAVANALLWLAVIWAILLVRHEKNK